MRGDTNSTAQNRQTNQPKSNELKEEEKKRWLKEKREADEKINS